MQTTKARDGSSDVPQKMSSGTRSSKRAQATGSDTDSTSSGHPVIKRPVNRSPKSQERKSPRTPVTEKHREGKVSELESQLGKLREDLKKAKEQLGASESWKVRAQQEAEESKKFISAMAAKLEDSQKQLVELSESEQERLQELRKISQERDRAWESELEALQNQHSADSAALSSALNDIQRLKLQLEAAAEAKASYAKQAEFARSELQALKYNMTETVSFIDSLKMQLENCKESETTARAMAQETLSQLEIAKNTIEKLRSDHVKALESFHSASEELRETKDHISSMEEERIELKCAFTKATGDHGVQDELLGEINSLKSEVERLQSSMEAAEVKHQKERSLASLEIQSAYEFADRTKSQSSHRIGQLQAELKKANDDILDLKANLMDKETELQGIRAENEGLQLELGESSDNQLSLELEADINKLNSDVAELKANLMDKETELQNILEENETLKAEIQTREVENGDGNTEIEAAKATEREALTKLNFANEEAEKSSRRAARMEEQLEAAQAANSEMEVELRRLRIQSDQWRKAAEAATSALSETNNNNVRMIERSASVDGMDYGHPTGEKMMSPYLDDVEDDIHMKKNTNVLKRLSLWKKGRK